MNLIEGLTQLEENSHLHMARLLVLISAFAGQDGDKKINGITKLAKLDFLLRYPVFLERALQARQVPSQGVEIAPHERKSVESKMVRYRFGPWDFRYRRLLNQLIAKGLVRVNIEGRTIQIGLTPNGIQMANELSSKSAFSDVVRRARILKREFDLSATNLMKFIYQTFPEIVSLRLGEDISNENQT